MRQHATGAPPPDAVGRRVVVRRRLHGEEHGATDVLGVLEAWSDGAVRVRTKDGAEVVIDEADVIAAKVIPARTVARRDVRDLEAAAALGWRGLEEEHLGGWLLRAAGGFTGRANSCLPLADPGLPLDAAVDAVVAWYEARALRPAFYVPEPLAAALAERLDARRWPTEDPTAVMIAPVADVVAGARPGLPAVRVDDRPDAAWLEAYHYRGGELPAHALDVLVNAELVGFASIDDHGERVTVARGAVSTSPAGRTWLGVTAVEVESAQRHRGLGTHIVAGLAAWAANMGATDVYLQVADENTAARRTYERLGFTEHHRYHYRRR